MYKYREYPCSLDLLVPKVRVVSNTHLLIYLLMYRLHIVYLVNNIILKLLKLSIIFLIHTLWYVSDSHGMKIKPTKLHNQHNQQANVITMQLHNAFNSFLRSFKLIDECIQTNQANQFDYFLQPYTWTLTGTYHTKLQSAQRTIYCLFCKSVWHTLEYGLKGIAQIYEC
jgi:hypothetical protein